MTRNSGEASGPDSIKCPSCGQPIPITETLRHQLSEQARAESRQELAEEQKAITAKEKALKEKERTLLEKEEAIDRSVEERVAGEKGRLAKEALVKARAEISVELRASQEAATEIGKKLHEAQETELTLRKEKRELEASHKALELEVSRKIDEERAHLREEAAKQREALAAKAEDLKSKEKSLLEREEAIEERFQERVAAEKGRLAKDALAKAREEVAVEVRDLRETAATTDKKLREAQERELELRKGKKELEAAKRALELEVARKMDEERERVREEARKEALEEHRLKDADKDRKLKDVLELNEELKRRLEQGSQQAQGETLELELEAVLKEACPFDEIVPVSKGVRGADVLQEVRTRGGLACGAILWETKRTKSWSDTWIAKLKEDQQRAKAHLAVLVTDALPKDVDGFGQREGVWITSPRLVAATQAALRQMLTEVAMVKSASASKDQTTEALFHYLTGPEFRNRVEAIVRAFVKIKEGLEEEKRATQRRWAKQDKQLDLVLGNTSGMYGDLQGLLGTSMKPIPALESGDAESADDLSGFESPPPVETSADEDVEEPERPSTDGPFPDDDIPF